MGRATQATNNRGPWHNKAVCGLSALSRFDEIIDVRTPAEFSHDHIPGAINAPVLNDRERVIVGTLYARESAFKAKRLGAALVARRIAEHLETLFADRPRDWKPLIYCWRGGKRSAAMVNWFNLIGWQACQLEGGYKSWRRHVIDGLAERPSKLSFIVLAGPTGSGKTRLLQSLARVGAQVLDLEALACHRGSLLGGLPQCPQPTQRGFETALFSTMDGLDPAQPVFVEAESRRIGRLDLPSALVHAMHAGRCVQVHAAMAKRIAFLLQDYAHLFSAPDEFKRQLERLTPLHGRKTITQWHALIDSDRRGELFQALVECHYDPAYRRSSRTHYGDFADGPSFEYDPIATDRQEQALALMEQLGLVTPGTASTSGESSMPAIRRNR